MAWNKYHIWSKKRILRLFILTINIMTIEIIYHVCALIFALLWFFMKLTVSGSAFLELVVKAFSKLGSIFVMGYALIQIFKLIGVL